MTGWRRTKSPSTYRGRTTGLVVRRTVLPLSSHGCRRGHRHGPYRLIAWCPLTAESCSQCSGVDSALPRLGGHSCIAAVWQDRYGRCSRYSTRGFRLLADRCSSLRNRRVAVDRCRWHGWTRGGLWGLRPGVRDRRLHRRGRNPAAGACSGRRAGDDDVSTLGTAVPAVGSGLRGRRPDERCALSGT